MSRFNTRAAEKKLSPAARKLYARIRFGHWYKPHAPRLPKAMAELIASGLVRRAGRVQVLVAAFVPHDAKDYRSETWPGKQR